VKGERGRLRDASAFESVLAGAAEVAGLLWEKGWAERNAGNLSFDVTDLLPAADGAGDSAGATPLPRPFSELGGRRFLVTAAGSRMREIAQDPDRFCGLLQCSSDGSLHHVAWEGCGAGAFVPTSELPSHLAIHAALLRRRSPHRAIVHTHPTELLALSHDRRVQGEAQLNRLLWAMHPEAVIVVPGGIGVVPFFLPGTMEQGLAAGAAMERHDVALWEKHGAAAAGATFAEAFDLLDTMNKAARLLLLCRAAGYEPEGLTDAQLDELRGAGGGGTGR
jgi:rhamnulose-1-phosphate aldolase